MRPLVGAGGKLPWAKVARAAGGKLPWAEVARAADRPLAMGLEAGVNALADPDIVGADRYGSAGQGAMQWPSFVYAAHPKIRGMDD